MDTFIYKENQKLRRGYTTGSCAAAAAKAAACMLLNQQPLTSIQLMTPKGILLNLDVQKISLHADTVTCAIQKDAGDDSDVTHGMLVYATVSYKDCNDFEEQYDVPLKKAASADDKIAFPYEKFVTIYAGEGVGKVTKKGLHQQIGEPAINPVPLQMIRREVASVLEEEEYAHPVQVMIFVPGGEKTAQKTFNPRLGIEGGISILGTSGIVEPMSEPAIVETIRAEIRVLAATEAQTIILTPGNIGEAFVSEQLGLDFEKAVKCSNFIGETIDMAYEFQLKGMLLVGHIGKLVKLGAGIMNTHSKWADGRMEVLVSCALMAGAPTPFLQKIQACITTDEAIELLMQEGILEQTMVELMKKIEYHLCKRGYEGLVIGAVVFSPKVGILGVTGQAEQLLQMYRQQGLK